MGYFQSMMGKHLLAFSATRLAAVAGIASALTACTVLPQSQVAERQFAKLADPTVTSFDAIPEVVAAGSHVKLGFQAQVAEPLSMRSQNLKLVAADSTLVPIADLGAGTTRYDWTVPADLHSEGVRLQLEVMDSRGNTKAYQTKPFEVRAYLRGFQLNKLNGSESYVNSAHDLGEATTNDNTFSLEGACEKDYPISVAVTVSPDGASAQGPFSASCASGQWRFALPENAGLSDGLHEYLVTQSDSVGHSKSIKVRWTRKQTPPQNVVFVDIDSPAVKLTLDPVQVVSRNRSGHKLTVRVSADTVKVEIFRDSACQASIGSAEGGAGSTNKVVTLTQEVNANAVSPLYGRARDGLGNLSKCERFMDYIQDSAPPTIAFLPAQMDAVIDATTQAAFLLKGRCTDSNRPSAGIKITVKTGTRTLGTADCDAASSTWQLSVNVSDANLYPDGANVPFDAYGVDIAGNSAAAVRQDIQKDIAQTLKLSANCPVQATQDADYSCDLTVKSAMDRLLTGYSFQLAAGTNTCAWAKFDAAAHVAGKPTYKQMSACTLAYSLKGSHPGTPAVVSTPIQILNVKPTLTLANPAGNAIDEDTSGLIVFPGGRFVTNEPEIGSFKMADLSASDPLDCTKYGVFSIGNASNGAKAEVKFSPAANFYSGFLGGAGVCHGYVVYDDGQPANNVSDPAMFTFTVKGKTDPMDLEFPGNGAAYNCGDAAKGCLYNHTYHLEFSVLPGGAPYPDPLPAVSAIALKQIDFSPNMIELTGGPVFSVKADGTQIVGALDFTVVNDGPATVTLSMILNVPGGDISNSMNIKINSNGVVPMRPTLAVRGISCLSCHAHVTGDVVTDFRFGNSEYFEKDRNQGWAQGITFSASVAEHRADLITGQLVIPKGLTVNSTDHTQFFNRASLVTRPSNAPSGYTASRTLQANGMTTVFVKDILLSVLNAFAANSSSTIESTIPAKAEFVVGAGGVKVLERTVKLRAPTYTEINALATQAGIAENAVAEFKKLGNADPRYFDGLEVVTANGASIVRNRADRPFKCYGDVVVKGVLYLKDLKLLTDAAGCRLYVTRMVFMETSTAKGIDYGDHPEGNLQIASSDVVALGMSIGGTMTKNANGAWQYQDFAAPPSVHPAAWQDGVAADFGLPPEHHYGTLGSRLRHNYDLFGTDLKTMPVGNKALHLSILDDEMVLYKVLKSSALPVDAQSRAMGRGATFEGLRLAAPIVYSRYEGLFTGSVLAEFAMFKVGDFKFSYDTRFDDLMSFPRLINPNNPIFYVSDQ